MEISPVDEEKRDCSEGGIPLIYPASELLRRLGSAATGRAGKSVRIRARQWGGSWLQDLTGKRSVHAREHPV